MTGSLSTWVTSGRALLGSRFLQQVTGTLVARLAIVALGLVGSVIIARSLGPSGRGEYAVAVAVSATAVQIGNLGLHTSSSWAASQRPELVGKLLANGVVWSFVVGCALGVAAWMVALAFPAVLPVPQDLLGLALVSVPFGLAYLVVANLLLGLQKVRNYNTLELSNRALSVAAIGALVAVGVASPLSTYGAVVAATLLSTVGGAAWIARRRRGVRPDRRVLIEFGGYGLRAYVAALFTFLVLRIDLLLVQYSLGSLEAGLYSIAVSLADVLYLLPVVVSTLLFPRLSAQSDRRVVWHEARRAVIVILALTSLLGLVAVTLGGPLITLLYGDAFSPATPAFQWLVPAVILLSAHTVLMHYYYAVGAPAVTIYAPLTGAALNVVLNLVLIPVFGIVGASLASCGAYAAMLILSWWGFARARPHIESIAGRGARPQRG